MAIDVRLRHPKKALSPIHLTRSGIVIEVNAVQFEKVPSLICVILLDNLIEEFLQMEKPTKEIIREFIEKIEIHSDKQVDIYFNFKPLQDLNNNFICAKKEYERKVG